MRETLSLLGIYLGIVAVLQVINVVASHLVGMVAPAASLFVFLGLFIAAFAVSWPIAVRISERMMPETDAERAATEANALAHVLKNLRPRTI